MRTSVFGVSFGFVGLLSVCSVDCSACIAQDYHHVYERYSCQIVNYIEDNETCKIDGDTIIVKKRGGGYLWGGIITGLFGLCTLGCILGSISTSDWWFEWQKKHNF